MRDFKFIMYKVYKKDLGLLQVHIVQDNKDGSYLGYNPNIITYYSDTNTSQKDELETLYEETGVYALFMDKKVALDYMRLCAESGVSNAQHKLDRALEIRDEVLNKIEKYDEYLKSIDGIVFGNL